MYPTSSQVDQPTYHRITYSLVARLFAEQGDSFKPGWGVQGTQKMIELDPMRKLVNYSEISKASLLCPYFDGLKNFSGFLHFHPLLHARIQTLIFQSPCHALPAVSRHHRWNVNLVEVNSKLLMTFLGPTFHPIMSELSPQRLMGDNMKTRVWSRFEDQASKTPPNPCDCLIPEMKLETSSDAPAAQCPQQQGYLQLGCLGGTNQLCRLLPSVLRARNQQDRVMGRADTH